MTNGVEQESLTAIFWWPLSSMARKQEKNSPSFVLIRWDCYLKGHAIAYHPFSFSNISY